MKRMRVFAGPNGSGKTTIFKELLTKKNIELGVYVNADDIESCLKQTKQINFDLYSLKIENDSVVSFFKKSLFSPIKRQEPDLFKKLFLVNNVLTVNSFIDSYVAADLAEFIRLQLLLQGHSFTYETVMSHPSKIDFLKFAVTKGYRIYLYFIATEDPEININRVKIRTAQNGHNVQPDVIINRYFKSLQLLKLAVKTTDRAYIFDNSGTQSLFVSEITNGSEVQLNTLTMDEVPVWVETYLFK